MFRRILCRGICLPLVFPSETLFRRRQKDRERVREPRTFADMFTFAVLCGHVHFYSLVRTCSLLQSCADMFTFTVLCGHVHFCSLVRTCSLLQSCADMFTFTVLCRHVHFYSLVRTCSLLQSCADMFTFAVLCGHVHFAVMFMYTLRIRRIRFAYATATFLQARNSRRHARTRTLSPRELCTESVHFKSVV